MTKRPNGIWMSILRQGWDCDGGEYFTLLIRTVEGGFRMGANLLGWILGVGACEGRSEEAQRTRQIFLSPPQRADPRQRGCEAEREDTDDGHAPGRPRLTCVPPAARVAFPTRAARPAGPMARTTLDNAALAWPVRTARRQINSTT